MFHTKCISILMRAMVNTSSIEVEKFLPYSWEFQFSRILEAGVLLSFPETTGIHTGTYESLPRLRNKGLIWPY